VVAVPPDREAHPVQTFTTFTHDLRRLAAWLQACGIRSVAMESTGVYWIAVYEILEAGGLEVILVNARHLKNVPGRKSDVSDAEWIRDLHSVGLLRGSFRPTAAIVTLRAYLRHRQTLIESAGMYVQRIHKALIQMNVQVPRVVSDITGVTGLRILRDIVAGQRDPALLASYRDPHCKASTAEIVAALTGHYLPEHVFVLQQNLALYDMCQQQMAVCDQTIDAHLQRLTAAAAPCVTPLPATRRRPRTAPQPGIEIRAALYQVTGGVDLTQIDGIAPDTALKLIPEIGTDMRRWPTAQHFTSWLTLAPKSKISAASS
jgi:transposase